MTRTGFYPVVSANVYFWHVTDLGIGFPLLAEANLEELTPGGRS